MLAFIILGLIIIFFVLVFIVAEIGRKNIERLWMNIKFEFIIFAFINVMIWIIKSIVTKRFVNFALFVLLVLIIFFGFISLIWNYYKNTSLRFEKSSIFKGVSDGYGRYTPRSGIANGLSLYSILLPTITILNICLNIRIMSGKN